MKSGKKVHQIIRGMLLHMFACNLCIIVVISLCCRRGRIPYSEVLHVQYTFHVTDPMGLNKIQCRESFLPEVQI